MRVVATWEFEPDTSEIEKTATAIPPALDGGLRLRKA